MFQILMKDREGRNVLLQDKFDEKSADLFVEMLANSGIKADKVNIGEERVHVVCVCFNLNDMNNTYTFKDPDNIAHIGDVVEVECTDGRRKNVLVTAGGMRTREQVKEFCAKIGYGALGKVTKLVWSASRK